MAEQPIRLWTRDKLEILGKYLHAYSTIMRKQRDEEGWLKSYSYIDAFANEGQYFDADAREYVDGSPGVALKCDPPFDDYWFIELRASRLVSLQANVTALPNRERAHFVQGDANEVLANTITRQIRREYYRRGFVFLDPYGLQVSWDTACRLAEARAFDVFVNFPVMGVNRLLDRDRLPDERNTAALERIIGDSSWIEPMYESQPDLFGETRHQRGRSRAEEIADIYVRKLKALFGRVSRPVIMRNSANAPLYALFLASHNETAVKITNSIFQTYERLGGRAPRR
ncbi:MAG: three-Cys-motif partner protein TcmP [Chloroflexi bacterium]|nr:three-Cys-motif partner protein TcmP [Chloroflexota bacterium]